VDKNGGIFIDKKPVATHELAQLLAARVKEQPTLRVLISGDTDARHGVIMNVLAAMRAAGIEKVAFEIRTEDAAVRGGT
jgi:biopolymer transport protein ExbD